MRLIIKPLSSYIYRLVKQNWRGKLVEDWYIVDNVKFVEIEKMPEPPIWPKVHPFEKFKNK